MVETIYSENTDELYQKAADQLAKEIGAIVESKKRCILAIPGGRSVVPLWKLLPNADIPWESVQIFMADERIVEPTSEESNYKLAKDLFINQLIEQGKLPAENVHVFIPLNSEDRGSQAYATELENLGGRVDVLILGVGEDGHVGALFPNHHSVKNDASGYIIMDDSPKPPPQRMTLSKKSMMSATVAFALFIGEAKKDAYTQFTGNELESCPVRLIKRLPRAYVVQNVQNT